MSPATSTNTRNFPILFNSQLNQEFNNFLSIILKLIILFTLVTLYLEQIIFITTDTSQKTNFTIGNIKTAATFAVNAVNDGGNLGQAIKQTTSKDSLKNIAISGIAAGLTAGILEGISPTPVTAGTSGAGDLGNATTLSDATPTAAPTSPTSLTIDTPTLQGPTFASTATSSPASEVNLASVGSNTANSANTLNTANTVRSISSFSDLTANFQRALTQSAVNGVSSAAAQSAIDGDSFKDSLKLQATNVLINAVGQVGAEQIGLAAHSGQISTPVQLTLHAGLGCAMAAAGSNNCAAGAAAGVTGELIGASLRSSVESGTIQKQTAISFAEVGSALAAATLAKPNDGDSVFAGSRIGHNSAEYNSLQAGAALVGGIAGAGGAAWGAYVGGADLKGTAIAAGTGFVFGVGAGFIFNPEGVLSAMAIGGATGSASSVVSSKITNPNIANIELFNNAIEGAIGGAVVAGTGALFTPAGSGIAGQVIGAQTAFPIDMLNGVMSAKYDILNTQKK